MADESRGTRNNFRQAQTYVDEQGRWRVDHDGSHQEAAKQAQPLTRGEAQKMIDAAFASLRIAGPGVSGSGKQWTVNPIC